jgi:hypothetical protein
MPVGFSLKANRAWAAKPRPVGLTKPPLAAHIFSDGYLTQTASQEPIVPRPLRAWSTGEGFLDYLRFLDAGKPRIEALEFISQSLVIDP